MKTIDAWIPPNHKAMNGFGRMKMTLAHPAASQSQSARDLAGEKHYLEESWKTNLKQAWAVAFSFATALCVENAPRFQLRVCFLR